MRYTASRLVPPLVFTVLLLISTTTAFGETWTDSTGDFSVEATFVKVEGRSVVLRKTDGNLINVPIDRLSDASRAMAKRLYETQKNGVAGFQQGNPGGELGFASRAMQPMLAAKNQTEFDQAVLESLTVFKTLAAIASAVRAENQN